MSHAAQHLDIELFEGVLEVLVFIHLGVQLCCFLQQVMDLSGAIFHRYKIVRGATTAERLPVQEFFVLLGGVLVAGFEQFEILGKGWSDDDFCTSVELAAFSGFVGGFGHILAAASCNESRRIDAKFVLQDAHDRRSALDTQVPVVFYTIGADRYVVGVAFDHHFDVGAVFEHFGDFFQHIHRSLGDDGTTGAEEELVGDGDVDHAFAHLDLNVFVVDVAQRSLEVLYQYEVERIALANAFGERFDVLALLGYFFEGAAEIFRFGLVEMGQFTDVVHEGFVGALDKVELALQIGDFVLQVIALLGQLLHFAAELFFQLCLFLLALVEHEELLFKLELGFVEFCLKRLVLFRGDTTAHHSCCEYNDGNEDGEFLYAHHDNHFFVPCF